MTRVTEGETAGDRLWARADLLTPLALRVAATLGTADRIREGLRTAAEIGPSVGADPDALDRMLRHLVSIDVFDRDELGRYSLTAHGETLCDDHPSGLRRLLDIEGALGRADLSAVHLLHSVRTGEAGFPALYGRSFWEDLASDPERTALYDRQMGSDVAMWAPLVIPAYDWGSLRHVIDIGGGNGTLLVALLDAFPRLHGTVFDQQVTSEAALATFETAGVAHRAAIISGSFFEPLPSGADAYLLSAILHDWNDEGARTILGRCAEAAGHTGKVFVIERTGPDGESPSTAMDLRMLLYFGGRERSATELTTLAVDAGLTMLAIHPAGDLSVIEYMASQ
jgi:hypothetical protein